MNSVPYIDSMIHFNCHTENGVVHRWHEEVSGADALCITPEWLLEWANEIHRGMVAGLMGRKRSMVPDVFVRVGGIRCGPVPFSMGGRRMKYAPDARLAAIEAKEKGRAMEDR